MSGDFLHPDFDRGTYQRRKIKAIPNKLAAFKFTPDVDPNVKKRYEDRKVQIINKKKYVNGIKRPEDEFFGSLKIF